MSPSLTTMGFISLSSLWDRSSGSHREKHRPFVTRRWSEVVLMLGLEMESPLWDTLGSRSVQPAKYVRHTTYFSSSQWITVKYIHIYLLAFQDWCVKVTVGRRVGLEFHWTLVHYIHIYLFFKTNVVVSKVIDTFKFTGLCYLSNWFTFALFVPS